MHFRWQKEMKKQKYVKYYLTMFLQLKKGLVHENIIWNTRSSYTFTFYLIKLYFYSSNCTPIIILRNSTAQIFSVSCVR